MEDIAKWCGIGFGNYAANPLWVAGHLYLKSSEDEVTELNIPDGVAKIEGCAFYGCVGLTKVTGGKNLTSIGNNVFNSCTGLASITIPNGVTTIGSSAFAGCTGLTSVTIPSNVENIGGGAFDHCAGLTSVTFKGDDLKSIGGGAFQYCGKLTSIDIPSSVTSIGNSAFKKSGLTSIVIPDNVEVIGKETFYECSDLKTVVVGKGVKEIGESAFSYYTGLESITFKGDKLESIGNQAFDYCTTLKKVIIEDLKSWCGVTFAGSSSNPLSVARHLYLNSDENEIKELNIPDGVTKIGDYAFYGCEGLTKVTGGADLTSIGGNAFRECKYITEVTVGDKVTSIGEYAFCYCTGMKSINIPSGVTTIGEDAFSNCHSLESVTIPSSMTKINSATFNGCTSLTSVVIPEGVTDIGSYAFSYCYKLKSVSIPSTVTSIGEQAFGECRELTSVTSNIQEPLTINSNVFHSNVKTKTTLYVPEGTVDAYKAASVWKDFATIKEIPISAANEDGVTIYYKYTDENKNALEVISGTDKYTGTVKIPATVNDLPVKAIDEKAFYQCTGLTSISIPEGVTSVGQYAFYGCNNTALTSIEIPSSVTYIGSCAFDCDKLTKVIIKDIAAWCKINFYGGNYSNPLNYAHHLYLKTDNGEKEITELRESDLSGVTNIGKCAFYNCKSLTSVTIPGSVTEIGLYAFGGCSNLTKVVVKDIATWCKISFGDYTNPLYYAKHLYSDENTEIKNLVIPDDVTSIGKYAFYNCEGLTSVTIPSSVENIGEEAFGYCTALNTITSKAVNPPSIETSSDEMHLPPSTATFDGVTVSDVTLYVPAGTKSTYEATEGWKDFTNIKELPITADNGEGVTLYYQYTDDSKTALEVIKGEGYTAETIKIPASVDYNGETLTVTSIGESAFGDCTALTSVSIGSGVKSIGNGAFYGCTGLESVTIPDNVETIGSDAFSQCSGLTSVSIGSGVKSIGEQSFHGCTNLTKVSSNIQAPPAINSNVFYTSTLTNGTLIVPKGTKGVYAAAEGWKEFTNIDDGTTEEDEDKDEDEEKPDEEEEEEEVVVTDLEYNLIKGGTALEVTKREGGYSGKVKIPEEADNLPVIRIGDGAFEGCTDLEAVEIPRSVTTIGDSAFNGCSALESITIRSTVESIGAGAFGGCTALKKVVAEDIPAWCDINFGNIESNPLHHAGHLYSDDYTEITDLTIPNTVKRIGEAAFAGCIGLRSVSIGNNLKSEDYYDGVKEIGNSAFYGCSNLISVTLRGSVESIGAFAFCDCDILDSIAIPSGVKEIGDMAFYCSNITKVVSYIQEPFAIKASVFGGNTLMNGTLRVPDGTVDKYKSTEGWREFAHIVGGISTGIEDINAGKVTIQANNGALNISGVKDGTRVVVYSMTGMVIGSGNVAGGTATIPTGLRKGDVVIVRIGDVAVKVMMQ